MQDEKFRRWVFHIFEQDIEQARRTTPFGANKNRLKKLQKTAKLLQKYAYLSRKIRPIIKQIERPFKKLRYKFYQITNPKN